jgi:hypothetical protein
MALMLLLGSLGAAQTRRPSARRAPEPPPKQTAAPEMTCPALLGVGVTTKTEYCDVLSGRDPRSGILITLPPRTGPATLMFDLHNRHTYSEEQIRANRAYARYTATIGVLTMDNTLISRAVVQSEFRKATDLVERIGGGAGPGGVKAVAPIGTEPIVLTIPEGEDRVSILGEKLAYERLDGSATYTSVGRPIAIISRVMVEYLPPPPPRTSRPAAARPKS